MPLDVILGPDSFGGHEEDFACAPDYDWRKCRFIERTELLYKSDSISWHCCVRPSGLESGECSFVGSDYRLCKRFLSVGQEPSINFKLQERILAEL